MTHHLAQINIGRLAAPLESEQLAEFVAGLDPINKLAESSKGFIWRLTTPAGNATDIAYDDDPMVIVNMSVWDSVESLRAYVYNTQHLEYLKKRAKWFEKMDKPHYCLWWTPVGHLPTVEEGKERLVHLQQHGPTDYSFWFPQRASSV